MEAVAHQMTDDKVREEGGSRNDIRAMIAATIQGAHLDEKLLVTTSDHLPGYQRHVPDLYRKSTEIAYACH